jgi:hypothetical protein
MIRRISNQFILAGVSLFSLLLASYASSQLKSGIETQRLAFIESLKDALITKNIADNRHFRLHNGQYIDKTDSMHILESKLITPIVFARLEIQQKEVALVPMILSDGGSGVFSSINVFMNRGGKPVQMAYADLGDRIRIDSIYVVHDTITVDIITQGPHDAMCCPTMPYKCRFLFRNDGLIDVSKSSLH